MHKLFGMWYIKQYKNKEVSSKAAVAAIHFGLSVIRMQKYLASLDVPTVSARTLKKKEKEK